MVRQTVYLSLSATVKQINSERDYNETELCHHDQAEVRGIGPPPPDGFCQGTFNFKHITSEKFLLNFAFIITYFI